MFYQVHLYNMGYVLGEQFESLELALAAARKAGFEAAIYRMRSTRDKIDAGYRIATWSPIAGTRTYL